MTSTFYAEAQTRAVSALQALLEKHSPGTFPYQVAERALDLAFNGLSELLASEATLLRQARSALRRQIDARLIPPVQPRLSGVPRESLCERSRMPGTHRTRTVPHGRAAFAVGGGHGRVR
jgi:hypothetical protein